MKAFDHLKSEHQLRVEKFMELAKQEVGDYPRQLTEGERILRAKLILEEAIETIYQGLGVEVACHMVIDKKKGLVSTVLLRPDETILKFYANPERFDPEQVVDGCCDLKVVTTGTLSACGIPDEPFQKLVDENNLAKFGPGHSWREDGKLIKPPEHKPPKIKQLIDELC